MRTIKQLPAGTPQETDLSKFPDSTIKNETTTAPGTPVVREIYGDILTNMYALLRSVGLVASGIEDNELNGYQLIDALQLLSNVLNDQEQVLTLSGTIFSVPLNLTILPDKYVLHARAAEAYVSSIVYTFRGNGTGGETYGFTCAEGFASGDELLLIIDQSGVRAFNISANGAAVAAAMEMFTPFGTPLAYSDNSAKVYYQSEGILFTDQPEAYDLQSPIRVLAGDGTILVHEIFQIGSYILCLAFNPTTLTYKFYKYALTNLAVPAAITGPPFPIGSDNQPYVYTDGTKVAITNSTGRSTNDYSIDLYSMNLAAGTMGLTGSVNLDAAFQKTTNAAINGNYLYTLISGVLVQYNLGSGVRTYGNAFPGFTGILFKVKTDAWFSTGEVAKKWTIPVF